jgi:myo-inositol-1(or 4)-monophosphatase
VILLPSGGVDMKQSSPSQALEFVRDALLSANESVRRGRRYGDAAQPIGRGASGDMTYKVDKDAEDAVLATAKRFFESPNIISEERGILKGGEDVWILLDPIDGSSNAKRDTGPFSTAVCVSTENRFGSVTAAGVIDHSSGRLIWGNSECVYENWGIASRSNEKSIWKALISFDSKFYMLREASITRIATLMAKTKYPRVFSTAALETAYVATGRIDAYVCLDGGLRTFDCMPSLFLLKKVGCEVSIPWKELDETRLDSSKRLSYVAACTQPLMKQILKILGSG